MPVVLVGGGGGVGVGCGAEGWVRYFRVKAESKTDLHVCACVCFLSIHRGKCPLTGP